MKRRTVLVVLCVAFLVTLFTGTLLAAKTEVTVGLRIRSSADTEYLNTLIAEFEKANPDITIKHFPLTGTWQEKITLMMVTGDAPDVIEMWSDFAMDWASNNMLKDLSPFVARDYSATEIRDFYPGQWNASILHTGPLKGLRYGIPKYTNVQIQFYHTDKFNDAGLATPKQLYDAKNWNWTTFLEAAKKLTRKDSSGNATQWGFQPRLEARWPIWVYGNGGSVFDFPNNPNKFVLDSPKALQALDFVRSLVWEHQVSPNAAGEFTTGKFAMADYWGSCCIVNIDKAVKGSFNWNIIPVPAGPVNFTPIVFNDMWGMPAGTKNAEAAWKFIKFAASSRGGELTAQYLQQQPARRSALPTYAKAIPYVDIKYTMDSAAAAISEPYALAATWKEAQALLDKTVLDIVYQNKPASLAVASVKPAVEAIYAGK